jgi:hypothetical protein
MPTREEMAIWNLIRRAISDKLNCNQWLRQAAHMDCG